MTRIPALEQELVTAAARRRRRRPRMSLRVLVPAVAALLVATTLVRFDDPEVEAPAGPGISAIESLRTGPLAGAVTGADPRFAPVSATAGPWTVAAFTKDGNVCMAAGTDADPTSDSGCSSAGLLAGGLERDQGVMYEISASGSSRLVFGLAQAGVRTLDIEIGDAKRRALVVTRPFTTEVTEQERRSVELDGGEVPPAGPVSFRLFVATFTATEVPDPDTVKLEFSMAYEDGTRASTGVLGFLNDGADSPAGCYREASLGTDTAVPGGPGTPVEVCRKFWDETGFEGTPEPEQLTACEGNGNTAWVFPGGPEVCERLGLPPYRE